MPRLASDPVFAALTRPQMIGGVTYSFAVFNLIVTLEAFLAKDGSHTAAAMSVKLPDGRRVFAGTPNSTPDQK